MEQGEEESRRVRSPRLAASAIVFLLPAGDTTREIPCVTGVSVRASDRHDRDAGAATVAKTGAQETMLNLSRSWIGRMTWPN